MTIKEVAAKYHFQEITVLDWCKKGYIRGLKKSPDGSYILPISVKPPYTKCRSKGDAIYTSIVKGVINGFDVCAALYGIDEAEFNAYIDELKSIGVLDSYLDSRTGIEYYRHTLKSTEFSKLKTNKIKKHIAAIKLNINLNVGLNVISPK